MKKDRICVYMLGQWWCLVVCPFVLCYVCMYSQLFNYHSISPFSGVISPTTFSFLSSPVATPRTTPRSTPIPRWPPGLVHLDENVDYQTMMANMAASTHDDLSGGTAM